VAEHIVMLLAGYGVDRVFLNPGTDTAPLQEAFAALREDGCPVPAIVLCPHESVALAAAHGYWKVTGRPQCVMVHVDVGTMNLGAMIHDVFRDRAGVLVLAGRAPYSVDPAVPGSRNRPLQWQQDVPDQLGILRGYAKLALEIARPDVTGRAVGRALQIAASPPQGISYLTVARDVLMEPAAPGPEETGLTGADPGGTAPGGAGPDGPATGRRFTPAGPAAIAPGQLAGIARLLAAASHPVIVTSRAGRDPAAAGQLARLAELLGAPVGGIPETVCIPWDHPLCVRSQPTLAGLLGAADAVLVLGCEVPWLPAQVTLPAGAQVVHVDTDPVKADMPLWSFPADLVVQADPRVAIGQLHAELERLAPGRPGRPAAWADRAARLSAWLKEQAPDRPGPRDGGQPVLAADVIVALDDHLSPADVVVEEAVTNAPLVHRLLSRPEPGTFHSAGGPGLGWGLGGAIGVKLAAPERRVVAVVGDGSFMFAVPAAALATAVEAAAPIVAVVLDNGGYHAAERPVLELFPGGAAARGGAVPGTRLARPPDAAALARACGAHGVTVTTAGQLAPALAGALAAADAGTPAVVHVIIERDGPAAPAPPAAPATAAPAPGPAPADTEESHG
jgi:acetolactate synthase-1/2/3 large subunit